MVGVNRQRVQDARRSRRSNTLSDYTKNRSERRRILIKAPRNAREKEIGKLVNLKKDLIRDFRRATPNELVRIPSDGSGVNYEYRTLVEGKPAIITFDFKFSFGEGGLRHIGLRVNNRRLINSAEWALVMDRQGRIEIFRIDSLRDFVKTKWGSISQRNRIRKDGYDVYPVNLDAILRAEGVKPMVCHNNAASIAKALKEIREIEFGKEVAPRVAPRNNVKTPAPQPKFTSRDAPKRIGSNYKPHADHRSRISAYRKV